jgi:2-oxoisovalerate dehydrogenase E1 component
MTVCLRSKSSNLSLAMVTVEILLKAYRLMRTAVEMAAIYEKNRSVCKYVHSTSRGHEAIQLGTAFHLQPCDWISPYYRDESILLGLGFEPYQLMLQLLAKGGDIFTGGREYYSHPNYRGADRPKMLHQSSATGMQAIPATGLGLPRKDRVPAAGPWGWRGVAGGGVFAWGCERNGG